ncbi:MAG: Fe-S oxidoreductase containing radical SAM domain [Rhodospirillaceae bacterium]|nr:MAG: Fe-S oxidoreductase containing radical SAM domain [Rhodospirillaceae bacterium]
MNFFLSLYDRIPPRFRRRLKNGLTLWLHRYFVHRPRILNRTVTSITIELTDKCNLRCSYCPKSMGIGVTGKNMNFDLFKKVVDDALAIQPISRVLLVGFGEPFLYPQLEEGMRYLREKNPSMYITTTSNGTLLSEEWARKMVEVGLNQITISVNATSREQYLQINRSDSYEKVVANTRAFLSTVNTLGASMRILVQVLEGPNGPDEISCFRKEWQPYLGHCGEIQVQPFVNWAGQIDKNQIPLTVDKSAGICLSKVRYPCAHLGGWLITREGNGLPCCMALPEDPGDLLLGNVRDQSIAEMFMGKRMAELRILNFEGKLSELSPCEKCDAHRSMPNVWIYNPLHRFFGPQWI